MLIVCGAHRNCIMWAANSAFTTIGLVDTLYAVCVFQSQKFS